MPSASRTRRRGQGSQQQSTQRNKRKRKSPATHNLKIKHCNPLEYQALVKEIGCINLYNTTVAEQKNGALKSHVSGRRNFVNIMVTLKRHINSEEKATKRIVSTDIVMHTLATTL